MCVIAAYGVQCLVAGCRGSGAGRQGVRPGRGMLHDADFLHVSDSCYHNFITYIHANYLHPRLALA